MKLYLIIATMLSFFTIEIAIVLFLYYRYITVKKSIRLNNIVLKKIQDLNKTNKIQIKELERQSKENREHLSKIESTSKSAQTYLVALNDKMISHYYYLLDIQGTLLELEQLGGGLEISNHISDEKWEDLMVFCNDTIETIDKDVQSINAEFKRIFGKSIEDFLDQNDTSANDKINELFPWWNQSMN